MTIGLGIGLTTAVFATVDGVMLKPLPYPDPERLVYLQGLDSIGNPVPVVSSDNWFDWKAQNRTLDAVTIHMAAQVSTIVRGEAIQAGTELVSPEFFQVFRPRLTRGRTFSPQRDEDMQGVVVSERFWRRALGEQQGTDPGLSVDGRAVDYSASLPTGRSTPRAPTSGSRTAIARSAVARATTSTGSPSGD